MWISIALLGSSIAQFCCARDPGNLSRCFWIPVERNLAKQESTSARNIHMDSNALLDANPDTQRQATWIPAKQHFAIQDSGHPLGFLHSQISLRKLPEITCNSGYVHMTLKMTTPITMYMAMLSLKNQYHRHTYMTKPIRTPGGRI